MHKCDADSKFDSCIGVLHQIGWKKHSEKSSYAQSLSGHSQSAQSLTSLECQCLVAYSTGRCQIAAKWYNTSARNWWGKSNYFSYFHLLFSGIKLIFGIFCCPNRYKLKVLHCFGIHVLEYKTKHGKRRQRSNGIKRYSERYTRSNDTKRLTIRGRKDTWGKGEQWGATARVLE